MKILGIDTILHDVCVAVVDDGRFVRSNVVFHTIMKADEMYRLLDLHLNQIGPAVSKALERAGCTLEDIDLVAVNNFGSFYSNVQIGAVAAETIAKIIKKPLLCVNHQEAHCFSNWLERDPDGFNFPVLVLSSSGGHSEIVVIDDNNFQPRKLYKTEGLRVGRGGKLNFRGIGTVYGYLAKILNIGGPIGSAPIVSRYARRGNRYRFDLYGEMAGFDITKLDFSKMEKLIVGLVRNERRGKARLAERFVADLAASFEESMGRLIAEGLVDLAIKRGIREVHLAGGIAANDTLRKKIMNQCSAVGLEFKYPKKAYCTDNAAMIASLGHYRYQLLSSAARKGLLQREGLKINSNLRLEIIALKQYQANKNKDYDAI